MSNKRATFITLFVTAIRFGLGAILAFAAFTHLKHPYMFLYDLLQYRVVAGWLAVAVAVTMPIFELIVAVLLFSRMSPRVPLLLTTGLLCIYFFVQSSALVRGLAIDCGCFGGVIRQEVGASSLALLSLLIASSVAGLLIARTLSDSGKNTPNPVAT